MSVETCTVRLYLLYLLWFALSHWCISGFNQHSSLVDVTVCQMSALTWTTSAATALLASLASLQLKAAKVSTGSEHYCSGTILYAVSIVSTLRCSVRTYVCSWQPVVFPLVHLWSVSIRYMHCNTCVHYQWVLSRYVTAGYVHVTYMPMWHVASSSLDQRTCNKWLWFGWCTYLLYKY